jgi:hypothetical protein
VHRAGDSDLLALSRKLAYAALDYAFIQADARPSEPAHLRVRPSDVAPVERRIRAGRAFGNPALHLTPWPAVLGGVCRAGLTPRFPGLTLLLKRGDEVGLVGYRFMPTGTPAAAHQAAKSANGS